MSKFVDTGWIGSVLSTDDAELKMYQAIKAIKIGNKTDDKLILQELEKLGVYLCANVRQEAK